MDYKINTNHLEELISDLKSVNNVISDYEHEAKKLTDESLLSLRVYSGVLKNNLKHNIPTKFTNDSINGKTVSGFKEFIESDYQLIDKFNKFLRKKYGINSDEYKEENQKDFSSSQLSVLQTEFLLEVVNEELQITMQEINRYNQNISLASQRGNVYIIDFIKDIFKTEHLDNLNPDEVSKTLEIINEEFSKMNLPKIPFDINVENIKRIFDESKSLDYYIALNERPNLELTIRNLRSAGLDDKFAYPLLNILNLKNQSIVPDTDIYDKYINRLGISFTDEHFEKVNSELNNKISKKQDELLDLKNKLIQKIDGFLKKDDLEFLNSFDNLINMDIKSADIDNKVHLLSKIENSIPLLNNFLERTEGKTIDVEIYEKLSTSFENFGDIVSNYTSKYDVEKLKINNLFKQLSDENLIDNLEIYKEISEIIGDNDELYELNEMYHDFLIDDLTELIYNFVISYGKYERLTSEIDFFIDFDLAEEFPEFDLVDKSIIVEAIERVNNIDEIKEFAKDNDVISNLDKFETDLSIISENENLSEANLRLIGSLEEYLKDIDLTTLNSEEFLEDFYEEFLENDNYKVAILLKETNNPLIKFNDDIKLKISEIELLNNFPNYNSLDGIIEDRESQPLYQITDLLFNALAKNDAFEKKFIEEASKPTNFDKHTDEIFLIVLKEKYPLVYDEILDLTKNNFDEIIDIFNSADFKSWRYKKQDENKIFEFLELETHSQEFKNRYDSIEKINPESDDIEIFFQTLQYTNPEVLSNMGVEDVEDFENLLELDYNFNYFRKIVHEVKGIEDNSDIENSDIYILNEIVNDEKFLNFVSDEISNNQDRYTSDNFNNKIQSIYNLLNNLDKENEVFDYLSSEFGIDKDFLEKVNIKKFKEFKYFYVNDSKVNATQVEKLQSNLETFDRVGLIKHFEKKVLNSIEDGILNINEESLEQLHIAVQKVKDSNINMNVEKLNEMFVSLIDNEELLELYNKYIENSVHYKNVEKNFKEIKEILISPKRKLGINSKFVPTSFDSVDNEYFKQVEDYLSELKSLNQLNPYFIEELTDYKAEAQVLKKEIKYKFIQENLKYILDNSNNEDVKKIFLKHFKGSKEDGKKLYQEQITHFQSLYDTLTEVLEIPEKRVELSNKKNEIDEKFIELDEKSNLTPDELELKKKLNQESEELSFELDNINHKFSNYINYFDASKLYEIMDFQKKTNTLQKKSNTLFKPDEKFIHNLTLYASEVAETTNMYEILDDFLKDNNIGEPDFNLKLKSILDNLVDKKYLLQEDAEAFYTEITINENEEVLEEFNNIINSYVSFGSSTVDFIDELIEHLKNDDIKTDDFVMEMKDLYSDEDIFKILSNLNKNKIINDKGFQEAINAFELDNVTDLNNNLDDKKKEHEESLNNNASKDNAFSKKALIKQIQGTDSSNGNEPKFGSASKVLFDTPYNELLNKFKNSIKDKEFLSIFNKKLKVFKPLLEGLEKGDIDDFNKTFYIKGHGTFSMTDLIKLFLAEEIMKDYPNHNLSQTEIMDILFHSEDTNFFFHEQMNKSINLLKDGFKNDFMKATKEKEIEELTKSIEKNAEIESSQFHEFKNNNEALIKIEKEKKILDDEIASQEKIIQEIKVALELEGISGAELDNDPQLAKYKENLANLKTKSAEKGAEISKLSMNKQKNAALMDEANGNLINSRQMLSQMNSSMDDNERLKNATLAQRMYILGDNNKMNEEEILNKSSNEMREIYLKDRNKLPLTETERFEILQKEREKKELSQGLIATLKERGRKQIQKLPFVNPLSVANRNLEYLGYSHGLTSIRGLAYLSKRTGFETANTMWKASKPFVNFLAKEGIKSIYWGHSKNAESTMSKLTGMNLNTSMPNLKDIVTYAVNRVTRKEEKAEFEKIKKEAPKKVEESLEAILEKIKHSSTPNKEFIKVMKNPMIKDIMNPSKRGKFDKTDISPSVLEKFREGMYTRLKDNLNYNINADDQEEAVKMLLDNMDASPEVLNSIITDNFEDYSKKGIETTASKEFNSLIKIMKGQYQHNNGDYDEADEYYIENGKKIFKKKRRKKGDYEASYNRFKKIIRKQIGAKIEEKLEVQKNELYINSLKFQDNFKKLKSMIDVNNPLHSLLTEYQNKFSNLISEHEDGVGNFTDPLKAGADIQFELNQMFTDISDKVLEALKKDPNNEQLIKLSNEITNTKFDINNLKDILYKTEQIIQDSEILLNSEHQEKTIQENINKNKQEIDEILPILNQKGNKFIDVYNKFISDIYNDNLGDKIDENLKILITNFVSSTDLSKINADTPIYEFYNKILDFYDALRELLVENKVSLKESTFILGEFKSAFDDFNDVYSQYSFLEEKDKELYYQLSGSVNSESLDNIVISDIETMYKDKSFEKKRKELLAEGKTLEEIAEYYVNNNNLFYEEKSAIAKFDFTKVNDENFYLVLEATLTDLENENYNNIMHPKLIEKLDELINAIDNNLNYDTPFIDSLKEFYKRIINGKLLSLDKKVIQEKINFLKNNGYGEISLTESGLLDKDNLDTSTSDKFDDEDIQAQENGIKNAFGGIIEQVKASDVRKDLRNMRDTKISEIRDNGVVPIDTNLLTDDELKDIEQDNNDEIDIENSSIPDKQDNSGKVTKKKKKKNSQSSGSKM